MTENYLIVVNNFRDKRGVKKRIKHLIEDTDSHKWVFGIEKGKGGNIHIQGRMRVGNDGFDWIKSWLPEAHVEKCSDTWTYEVKDGHYWASWDTTQARKTRFGKPKKWQKQVIEGLRKQNDRQIMCIVNRGGNEGKSWLRKHLWQTGKAQFVQYSGNVKSLIQDVASEYIDNTFRPYLVVDFPRAWKWNEELCIALETIKDGLIKDTRYSSRSIDIEGVKVVVFCNTSPNDVKGVYESLSADRWCIGNLSSGTISWESRTASS